ncbi:MAG: alpha/beta hydrolase [Betaproteobacteria bacterium]
MSQTSLLLVPGLMCDHTSWAPMLPYLNPHIAHTTIDHGDADSLVAMAERILENAPAVFDLAGHSMGGRVALEVMRLAPQRVRRLALLGTGYRAKESGEAGAEELRKRQVLLDIARAQGVRAMAVEWVKPMVAPSRLSDLIFVEQIIAMICRKSEDIFKRQIKALIERPDASNVLSHIQIPTLVMAGAFDGWATPAQHQEIADLIPSKPDVAVTGPSGHMMMMEEPQLVAQHFNQWLA